MAMDIILDPNYHKAVMHKQGVEEAEEIVEISLKIKKLLKQHDLFCVEVDEMIIKSDPSATYGLYKLTAKKGILRTVVQCLGDLELANTMLEKAHDVLDTR